MKILILNLYVMSVIVNFPFIASVTCEFVGGRN